MQAIIFVFAFLVGALVGTAFLAAISIAAVYLYLWVMNGLFHIPYVPASSTLFVIITFGVIVAAIKQMFTGQFSTALNIGAGVITLLIAPLTYAAAFNLHATWTHTTIDANGPYLPGDYWAVATGAGAWITAQVSQISPAIGVTADYIGAHPLLTQIFCSALTSLFLTPLGQKMWRTQTAGGGRMQAA